MGFKVCLIGVFVEKESSKVVWLLWKALASKELSSGLNIVFTVIIKVENNVETKLRC